MKYFKCKMHNDSYILYCNDCKKNICILCEKDHLNHNKVSLGVLIQDKNKLEENKNNLRNFVYKCKSDIQEIINKLNKVMDNIESYFNIYNNMINGYEIKNRNYQILQNLNDMNKYNTEFINELNVIINEKNLDLKFKNLMNIYNKIYSKKSNNNEEIYSFECPNKENLTTQIDEGTDNASIEVIIKNSGNKQWPLNLAKLVFDRKKNIIGENVILLPQKPGECKNYIIKFLKLKSFPDGIFSAAFYLEVNGKKYGEKIDWNIIIEEKNKNIKKNIDYKDIKNNNIDYQEYIDEFRDTFNLYEKEYTDELLLNALKKNNFDLEKAFSYLFDVLM